MANLTLQPDSAAATALLAWHKDLHAAQRGDRAALRRAASPAEVAFVPAFHRLLFALQPAPWQRERLAIVASLAARIRHHREGLRLAVAMGTPAEGASQPRVSEARARRLFESADTGELFTQLRRVQTQAGETLDLVRLAKDLLATERDQPGLHPHVRRDWTYDYYGTLLSRTEKGDSK